MLVAFFMMANSLVWGKQYDSQTVLLEMFGNFRDSVLDRRIYLATKFHQKRNHYYDGTAREQLKTFTLLLYNVLVNSLYTYLL